MQATGTKLTGAVEEYLGDLRRIRASGGATGERSYYPALSNLLNAVGGALRPKVFCVSEMAQQGAGHPDFGLYAAKQVQKGQPKEGQLPECGVVEVKSAGDDAWLTADSEQVSTYWNTYRLVLVTNTRDFVLVGEDAAGKPVKLETFRLAESEAAFEARLQHPRAFAHEVGAGLGEYLCRALSHRATLVEPKDVAWLLASYARDGLARVEAAGDAASLAVVRSALEEALGVRFEGEKGAAFFRSTLVQTLFYGVFSAWVLWARQTPAQTERFNWHEAIWHLRAPVLRALFQQVSSPSQLQPLGWWRCWTGRRRRWTVWSAGRSSTASARVRPCPTSTSRSWRPSTPCCASSSASGTRPPRWCATWSPAWTGRSGTTWASPTGWRLRTCTCSIRAAARAPTSPRCCAASPPTWRAAASAR